MHGCMYDCMHVCMYMCVYIYACMYECICIDVYTGAYQAGGQCPGAPSVQGAPTKMIPLGGEPLAVPCPWAPKGLVTPVFVCVCVCVCVSTSNEVM